MKSKEEYHELISKIPEAHLREYAEQLALQNEWLQRQVFGHVVFDPCDYPRQQCEDGPKTQNEESRLMENGNEYLSADLTVQAEKDTGKQNVSVETLPRTKVELSLPHEKLDGLSQIASIPSEIVVRRKMLSYCTQYQIFYAATDESGNAAAGPAPAYYPAPDGGDLKYDVTLVAWIVQNQMLGLSFDVIAGLLENDGLTHCSSELVKGLFSAAIEDLRPLCALSLSRAVPCWDNMKMRILAAERAGDWRAQPFHRMIHALSTLEDTILKRARNENECFEMRAFTRKSQCAHIVQDFFSQCRDAAAANLPPRSLLRQAVAFALEHEQILCTFLHDPMVNFYRGKMEVSGVAASLSADRVISILQSECNAGKKDFGKWLEDTLVILRRTGHDVPIDEKRLEKLLPQVF